MPTYVYKCREGHVFEQRCKIDGSDEPTSCPTCIDGESINCRCEAAVQKILVPTASVFPGADSWRKA